MVLNTLLLLQQPEDLGTTPSLLQQYSAAKQIITENSIENKRCTLLPKYGILYKLSKVISLFMLLVVLEVPCIPFHLQFQYLMSFLRIIQSGCTGRDMCVPSVVYLACVVF